jgi:hypothetical protein
VERESLSQTRGKLPYMLSSILAGTTANGAYSGMTRKGQLPKCMAPGRRAIRGLGSCPSLVSPEVLKFPPKS